MSKRVLNNPRELSDDELGELVDACMDESMDIFEDTNDTRKETMKVAHRKVVNDYIFEVKNGLIYFKNFLNKHQLYYFNTYANFILVDFKNQKIFNKVGNMEGKKSLGSLF